VGLTLRRPLKCLLTAVAPMLPPDLVIKAFTSSLVTKPEALMAGEEVGSCLMVASFLMVGAAASSDLIAGSCASKMLHSSVMNKLEGAVVMNTNICSHDHTSFVSLIFVLHTDKICDV